MKRKFIDFLSVSFVLMTLLTVASCSNDDDPVPQPATDSSIVGEWFYDMNSSKLKSYSIEEYTSSGTINQTFLYCYPNAGHNLLNKKSGTYTITGKTLTTQLPETGKSDVKIYYLDEYTLVQEVISDGSQETYYKIVSTLDVKVGESVRFEYDNDNFQSFVYYKSCDENIVKVDNNGSITGVKRGTAYVVARSAVGAVVARVNVTDPERTIDEFDHLLGLSKNEVLNKFDENFMQDLRTGAEYVYYPGDGEIKGIYFRFSHDKLSSVMVEYWEVSTLETATSFLQGKFDRVGKEDNGFNSFQGENENCKFYVYTDRSSLCLGYEMQQNDFDKYDSHINDTADEYAAMFGKELTPEDDGYSTFYINGELYYGVSMIYDEDTRLIQMLSYTCQEGVTVEQMEEYVKAAYDSYYDGLGYYKVDDLFTNPIFVNVTTNKKGYTLVKYTKL